MIVPKVHFHNSRRPDKTLCYLDLSNNRIVTDQLSRVTCSNCLRHPYIENMITDYYRKDPQHILKLLFPDSSNKITSLSLQDRVNIAKALRQRLIDDKQFVETQIAMLKVGLDQGEDLFEVIKKVMASTVFDFLHLNPSEVKAYLAKMN